MAWFGAVAKLINNLSDFHTIHRTDGSDQCLVVGLNGLDGAIGLPPVDLAQLENAAHLDDLDPVHQAYAQWALMLVPHTRLRGIAEKIHDELSSSSVDSETTICLHARISSCTDLVIAERKLDPAHLELALRMAEKDMSVQSSAVSDPIGTHDVPFKLSLAVINHLKLTAESTELLEVCMP